MFTRFRQTRHRLQVSLVETRRLNGKVHHEHVASLGSVETPPSVPERIAFWLKLHDRLGKLSNRIDAATQGKVLGAVHARIAMVTADEQCALQLENAEADAQFWLNFRDMNAEPVEGHKGLVAQAERKIADGQSATANAAANAAIAKERIERLKRGENVEGGLGKPRPVAERTADVISDFSSDSDVGMSAASGTHRCRRLRGSLLDKGTADTPRQQRQLCDS
jgi:hypothetical protein